jgi:chromatin remodeling complex protein RSC6
MTIKVEDEELETTKEVENGEEKGEECDTVKMEVEETKENTSIVVNS